MNGQDRGEPHEEIEWPRLVWDLGHFPDETSIIKGAWAALLLDAMNSQRDPLAAMCHHKDTHMLAARALPWLDTAKPAVPGLMREWPL